MSDDMKSAFNKVTYVSRPEDESEMNNLQDLKPYIDALEYIDLEILKTVWLKF